MSPLVTDFHHTSVLPAEVLFWLNPKEGDYFCDCTLGGGGHTYDLAKAGANVIALDRDQEAITSATARLEPVKSRVLIEKTNYANFPQALERHQKKQVQGFLLDIGVSSRQLDGAERGFSFSKAGPIDMRMDQTDGETALELIERVSESELADIIYQYGEERRSRPIARAIKTSLARGELDDTEQLAKCISRTFRGKNRSKIHPATRTFQALRIAVNDELGELETFLKLFSNYLSPGGRCVIISFHSLEDRIVKHAFRSLERESGTVKVLTKKVVCASDNEKQENPRSRSAKLRACERVAL